MAVKKEQKPRPFDDWIATGQQLKNSTTSSSHCLVKKYIPNHYRVEKNRTSADVEQDITNHYRVKTNRTSADKP